MVESSNTQEGKPKVFFVLGRPGSGKGTQCTKLVNEHGFVHLSAGDLLRAEMARPESEYGKLIDDIIKEGKIVPVEITCNLIKNAMEAAGWASKKFLVDGFPRNKDNYDGWMKVMGEIVEVVYVLVFDCDEEELTRRIMDRAGTSGRTDDNIETLKKRFKQFVEEGMPIIEIYEKEGKVKNINGDQEIDQVTNDVKAALEGYLD